MAIMFTCPYCGQKLKTQEELRGRTAKCPKCQNTFDIPDASAPPPEAESGSCLFICPECGSVAKIDRRQTGQIITCRFCGESVTAVPAETRICPKCGKTIKIGAVVCKYCRNDIPPIVPRSERNTYGGGPSRVGKTGDPKSSSMKFGILSIGLGGFGLLLLLFGLIAEDMRHLFWPTAFMLCLASYFFGNIPKPKDALCWVGFISGDVGGVAIIAATVYLMDLGNWGTCWAMLTGGVCWYIVYLLSEKLRDRVRNMF